MRTASPLTPVGGTPHEYSVAQFAASQRRERAGAADDAPALLTTGSRGERPAACHEWSDRVAAPSSSWAGDRTAS